MKKELWVMGLITGIILASSPMRADNGLLGWAVYESSGLSGTTGGGYGTIVRVTTRADLEKYAKTAGAYVILVEGELKGSGTIKIESNKTIIGTAGGATLDGIGFDINGKENIILRNLTIKNAKPDAIAFRNTHHVWIDHCDLSASDDGLLDYTIGSSFLTVSWTRLHHHDKVSIANSGTQHFEDVGKNKVTYHHNWFYNNVQRNPRVGYGMGHVFNNYYSDISSYCVGYHTGASVLVERNYFYKSKSPLNQMYSSDPTVASYADAKEVENIFDNTSGNTKGTGKSFAPEDYYNYKFALDAAKDIPSIVQKYSGPVNGIEYEVLPLPNNGTIDYYKEEAVLSWTKIENVTSWNVYFGKSPTSLTKISQVANNYKPELLEPETEYYWKVDAICPDTLIEGQIWRFRTAPAKAAKPSPADGEFHAQLREATSETTTAPASLKWMHAFGAVKYRVYLGEHAGLTEEDLKGEVTATTFAPGALKYGVKYYWKVSAIKEDGTVEDGNVWNFTSDIVYSQEGRTEMENMVLNVRAFVEKQDGAWFAASNNKVVAGEAGPGTMSSIWSGDEVKCDVTIAYFDESDGTGGYQFYVNEERIKKFLAAANNDKIVKYVIPGVHLCKGDEIRLEFYPNAGEMNRTDYMDIAVTEILTSVTNLPESNDSKMTVYPTVFDSEFNILLTAEKAQTALFRISDLNGREVFRMTHELSSGSNTVRVTSPAAMPSQMYIIEMIDPESGMRKDVKRVIKK